MTLWRNNRLQFEGLGNKCCLASIWILLYFHLIRFGSCVTAGIKKKKSWLIWLLNLILFVMLHPSSSRMSDYSVFCTVWFDFMRFLHFRSFRQQIWHLQVNEGWSVGPCNPMTNTHISTSALLCIKGHSCIFLPFFLTLKLLTCAFLMFLWMMAHCTRRTRQVDVVLIICMQIHLYVNIDYFMEFFFFCWENN